MADLGAIGYAGQAGETLLGPAIEGVVLDDASTPAERRVTVQRRDTLALVWDTTSRLAGGGFVAPLPPGGAGVEYLVIYHDDDAGTLHNDLVNRVIP